MLKEMLQAIRPRSGGVYLDGTLGSCGYSRAILEESDPDGFVVGIDLDPEAIWKATERLERYQGRFIVVHGGFHQAGHILESLGIFSVDAAVLDLGLSSEQLEDSRRGFSFRSDGPLDMRFDTSSDHSLRELLDQLSVQQLEDILLTYGEARYFRKLARGILLARDRGKIQTTGDLANVVSRLIGKRRGKIHPATRTFQALRISLNREMENLSTALHQIPGFIKPGGRLCVVSYHSLEDRLVKLSFRERKRNPGRWKVITPKPIQPSPEEILANPRARSAKMRVLEVVS